MAEGASEFSEVRDFFYGRHLLRSEIPFSDHCIKRFIEKEYNGRAVNHPPEKPLRLPTMRSV